MKKTKSADQDFPTSFQSFTGQRGELLKVLRRLDQQAWLRRASVKATTVREETVFSCAQRLAITKPVTAGKLTGSCKRCA